MRKSIVANYDRSGGWWDVYASPSEDKPMCTVRFNHAPEKLEFQVDGMPHPICIEVGIVEDLCLAVANVYTDDEKYNVGDYVDDGLTLGHYVEVVDIVDGDKMKAVEAAINAVLEVVRIKILLHRPKSDKLA